MAKKKSPNATDASTTSTVETASTKKTRRLKKPVLITLFSLISVLALVCIALAIFTLSYRNKIYPHTYIGNQNFGGMTRDAATQALQTTLNNQPKKITITLDTGKTVDFPLDNIGLAYDVPSTVDTLYKIGRVGSITDNFVQLFNSVLHRNTETVVYTADSDAFQQAVVATANKVGTQAQDAKITLNANGTVSLTAAKAGNGLDKNNLATDLHTALANLNTSISEQSVALTPTIQDADAQNALTEVKTILSNAPLTLTAQGKKTTADAKTIFSWIIFTNKNVATPTPSPTTIPGVSWLISHVLAQETPHYELTASLDQTKIKQFVADFATTVNQDPQDAQLQADDSGTIKVVKDPTDGEQLKVDESTQLIASKLVSDTNPGPLSLDLPVQTVTASVTSNTITSLGINELIGQATTDFSGSPSNRIHNIQTGAKFLNGAIVMPGQEFSTIATLGKIDGSTGYLPELVILNNSTLPEYGGGLCQVSTTLFRSVLNAGLPVTERQNHSYRVSYYEPPIGLDATIYDPKPDFKFKNDTGHAILIQDKVDGNKITFSLYGTKDGRTSTVSDPIVSDIIAPPAPIYTNTDTLPKGTVKQTDHAHPGSTAVVTYTVSRNGQVINQQTFRSKYTPWAAKYLVGTKE